MISKKSMFSLISKLPKFFISISLFIVIFLQCFLLLGCTSSNSTYSNVYLTKIQYNSSSEVFDIVKNAYKSQNSSSSIDMTIRVGYLSTCVKIDGDTSCASYDSLEELKGYSGISIFSSDSSGNSTELNLVQLAKDFSRLCPFKILLASIIISLILFVTLCYSSTPLLPGKSLFIKINCVLSAVNVLLWGFGSMLQHMAVQGAIKLIPASSLTIIAASKGSRAEAMIWTAFSFLFIVCLGNIMIYVRQLKKAAAEFQPKF